MATTVTVTIVGRSYDIGCGDGQEEIVRAFARQIDDRALGLLRQVGQVADAKLLLMVALTLAEELSEAQKSPSSAPNGGNGADQKDDEAESDLADSILALARRLDTIAERLGDD